MNQHRKGNGFDAGVPGDPRLHDAINRRTPRGAGMQVTNTHAGTILAKGKKRRDSHCDPYKVTLSATTAEEVTIYEVTVGWGYVCERLPGYGDAIEYHEADNMWEKDEEGVIIEPRVLAKHAIEPGQAVYIKVEVDANGNVVGPDAETPAVEIVIDSDDVESIHYIPKVDNETPDGDAGTYYYKLAVLEAGPPLILKKWMTGSHLEHFQELPSIKSTLAVAAGIGVVPKKWDNDDKHYKIRALTKGLGRNNITTNADDIEVRGTKLNAGVYVWYRGIEPSTPLYNWEDGYNMTGTEVIGDEVVPPDPQKLDILMPTVVQIADPQVHVTDIGVGDQATYEVRGNSKDGSLTYTIDGESPETLLEWVDGLVTTMGPQNIPIPAIPDAGTANLNQLVKQVYFDGSVFEEVSEHYLCWRLGLYVGKFDAIGDCPAHVGTLDTSTVTYIGTDPPP